MIGRQGSIKLINADEKKLIGVVNHCWIKRYLSVIEERETVSDVTTNDHISNSEHVSISSYMSSIINSVSLR
jgi:hypothetical protein